MTAFDWRRTAAAMKPHEFELLVREYASAQALRVQATLGSTADVRLGFDLTLGSRGAVDSARWSVDIGWSGNTAKGEVLDGAADELIRREQWQKVATLRQIEG